MTTAVVSLAVERMVQDSEEAVVDTCTRVLVAGLTPGLKQEVFPAIADVTSVRCSGQRDACTAGSRRPRRHCPTASPKGCGIWSTSLGWWTGR